MKHIFAFLSILIFIFIQPILAQEAPFNRGVNLTGWFQASNIQEVQFTRYTKKDFKDIQDLNCDVIRLPINLHSMTSGAPDYILDPLFLNFLDQVADWAEELNMHLIFDNHTFDPSTNTNPNIGATLKKVWVQMAQHYKDRSDLIYYEILNEPHGISDTIWNQIQQEVIDEIRSVDNRHTIIVGGAGWNSYNNLNEIPEFTDQNLIYTFHFYDPFVFTHQGASWVNPSMVALANVPFPYHASEMPGLPASLVGTWVGSGYNNYANDGTVAKIHELLDIAIQFKETRNVPVFCGEFGVLMDNCDNADRVYWYEEVRSYLEENKIAWTVWDYHGGFGLFEPGSDGLYNHDLNIPLLHALDFAAPMQTPFMIQPDSLGFYVYSDYIENKVLQSSNSPGNILFYSQDLPNNGDYCVRWSNASQYQTIGFDFKPDRDLVYLKNHNFALDFFVRGNTPGTRFDIRFLDTDTEDPDDHPWRMRTIIDESDVSWDGHWHHLHIPLSEFLEHGAWENGTWYSPQGDFEWTEIDRLEFVAEYFALDGATLWFDNLQITDLDTATVNESGVFTSTHDPMMSKELVVFPNPVEDLLTITHAFYKDVEWLLLDQVGHSIAVGNSGYSNQVNLSGLPPGIYFLHWAIEHQQGVEKIVKL